MLFSRKREFILLFGVMLIIALCVSFYVNYHLNHITIDGHIYVVDDIQLNSWHFVSETGEKIIVSRIDGKPIYDAQLWRVGDMKMSIGKDVHEIYRDYDRDRDPNFFIDLNDEQVKVNRIYNLVSTRQTPILAMLIVMSVLITILACTNMEYPELAWKFRMMFVTRGGEPTDFYLGMTRISGFLIWIISLFAFIKLL